MFQDDIFIKEKKHISGDIFLITFSAKRIAPESKPGQFVNIKIGDLTTPYLRRPFSICEADNDSFSIMFNIAGSGTKLLALAEQGNSFNCIGPLGNGFNYKDDFKTAILVAGGIGVAPFPFLISRLENKNVTTYLGARNSDGIINYKLGDVKIATDDGSMGERMNVVELLAKNLNFIENKNDIKIFGCGPTPMLKSLMKFSHNNQIDCEISTECAMACGFGLCQGCPIESSDRDSYLLICKDGPVFNIRDILL